MQPTHDQDREHCYRPKMFAQSPFSPVLLSLHLEATPILILYGVRDGWFFFYWKSSLPSSILTGLSLPHWMTQVLCQLTTHVQPQLQALHSVLLMYLSLLRQTPYCPDFRICMLSLKIKQFKSSNFVFSPLLFWPC